MCMRLRLSAESGLKKWRKAPERARLGTFLLATTAGPISARRNGGILERVQP